MTKCSNRDHDRERGAGLITTIVLLLGLLASALLSATIVRSETEIRSHASSLASLRARTVARAGMEAAAAELARRLESAPADDPFAAIEGLHNRSPFGTQAFVFQGETLGEYVISFQVAGLPVDSDDQRDAVHVGWSPGLTGTTGSAPASSSFERAVTVLVTSFVPSRSAPPEQRATHTIEAGWSVGFRPSDVFHYSYFINNWGWFYGNTIVANGNVRANGQFDFGGYRATVNGQPEFRVENGQLGEEISNGGVYAGWGVVGAENARGMAADPAHHHGDLGDLRMPNLSDLTPYEAIASEKGGKVRVAGDTVVEAVLGDDPGEPANLYLEGTEDDPIEIDGPVVVRGSVIIKGVVTGIGTIYASGNIYIADDVTYANPPDTPRPAETTREGIQAWIDDNADRDLLGLFARENIVIGDPKNNSFKSYVGGWLNHPANESREDLGLDHLPQTAAGRDGVWNTADDDVLEGDGTFSIETYTDLDALLGRIPPGRQVGDPIPGTGEDVDGDGVFDERIGLSDFDLPAPLDSGQWAGNVPPGASKISDVASIYIRHVDGALYTNHALAARVHEPSDDITFNGALVSRNEAIVYSVPAGHTINMNHDARLLVNTDDMGFYLPRTPDAPRLLYWIDRPNPAAATESVSN